MTEILKINKGLRFRILPTKEQEIQLNKFCGCSRFVYNWALARRKENYEENKTKEKKHYLGRFEQSRELTALKKMPEYDFLKEPPSDTLIYSLIDLELAFKAFFKQPEAGYPKFKNKSSRKSFAIQARMEKYAGSKSHFYIYKTSAKNHFINLPKLPKLKINLHRDIEGTIKSAVISKELNHWYIAFTVEKYQEIPQKNELEPIGIDLGVATNVTCSDGYVYQLPEKIRDIQKRVAVLQARASKKKKFSANWYKANEKIAKLKNKEAKIRRHYHHEASRELVKFHSLIAMEDLNIKNMSKSAKGDIEQPGKNVKAKSGLNRSILQQGWGSFGLMLEYKAKWYNSEVIKVAPKNTSRQCSSCGYTHKDNRKSQAIFNCLNCGTKLNADINAAINILNKATPNI